MANKEEAKGLAALRRQIDQLDDQLLELLNRRATLAMEVAQVKQAAGENGTFWRPEREAEVLQRVMARNPGPLDSETVAWLFRELMSACLALERPLTVAYLGPAGTFTQMAATKHFGQGARLTPVSSIPEVFRTVQAGQADFGVVPVENSTEGSVNLTLDHLLDYPLKVCGEVQLRVVHNLVSAGVPLADMQRIYVHYQTRAQCRHWLAEHAPRVQLVEVASNAEAALRAREDAAGGAISTAAAAELYGLRILAAGIEDDAENTTRFLVIGDLDVQPTGRDKTSLVLSSHNRPGSLHELLRPLAAAGISMTRIESRPARRGLWQYVFFLDLEGHAKDPAVAAALAELQEKATFYKLLGTYPKAVI
ncbi:MAG: prephenate dehydratase [Pseudomonadota bacterium]|uniref:prephenate dehydratase n=1 Tax=Thermithiobacillus tepidarius TaxID=929 RepID=UPI00042892FC|nr:prephenate dehydratase [Thermithiobacillus tepidarius]